MAFLAAVGSFLASNAGIIGAISTGVGAVVSAAGARAQGRAQRQAAERQAQMLEINAKNEKAAAQRQALQLKRNKELAISTAQARAGGSGFDPTDPTTLDITGEIERYGTLQEQSALFGGLSRAEGLTDEAASVRATGAAQEQASKIDAASTLLGGITSMARFRT